MLFLINNYDSIKICLSFGCRFTLFSIIDNLHSFTISSFPNRNKVNIRSHAKLFFLPAKRLHNCGCFASPCLLSLGELVDAHRKTIAWTENYLKQRSFHTLKIHSIGSRALRQKDTNPKFPNTSNMHKQCHQREKTVAQLDHRTIGSMFSAQKNSLRQYEKILFWFPQKYFQSFFFSSRREMARIWGETAARMNKHLTIIIKRMK